MNGSGSNISVLSHSDDLCIFSATGTAAVIVEGSTLDSPGAVVPTKLGRSYVQC